MANVELLDKVEKRAYELFDKFGSCAQSSFWAIHETFGYKDELAIKAVVVLSGGVGGMGSVCGALTGSALGLGLKYGRDVSSLKGKTREEAIDMEHAAAEMAEKLARWFEREFGNLNCYELRKAHMGTFVQHFGGPPWHTEWYEALGTSDLCRKMVGKAARRAAAMFDNPNLGILDKV